MVSSQKLTTHFEHFCVYLLVVQEATGLSRKIPSMYYYYRLNTVPMEQK